MTRIAWCFAIALYLSCSPVEKPFQPDQLELKSFFSQIDDSILTKRTFLVVDTVQKAWKAQFISYTSDDNTLTKEDIEYIEK